MPRPPRYCHCLPPMLALLTLATLPCDSAQADGGQLRVSELRGDMRLTVFTSPVPLRAGPIDISVLAQNATTGVSRTDVEIVVQLTSDHRDAPPLRVRASTAAATNKLLQAALVDLPAAGVWNVSIEYSNDGLPPLRTIDFSMEAAPPLPPWLTVWPWFTWPLLPIMLFLVHRYLVARRDSRHSRQPRETGNGAAELPILAIVNCPSMPSPGGSKI